MKSHGGTVSGMGTPGMSCFRYLLQQSKPSQNLLALFPWTNSAHHLFLKTKFVWKTATPILFLCHPLAAFTL